MAPDAREQLLTGMVQVASAGGYSCASVARLVDRTGVSRRAFYAQFRDREDCFLAAYRAVVARGRTALSTAAAASSPADRPRAVLDALVHQIVMDPAAARLVFLEADGAPLPVRREHWAVLQAVEVELDRFLCRRATSGPPLQIPAAALRTAIQTIVSMRLLREEADSLPGLLDDLVTWVGCYRLPAGENLRSQRFWSDLEGRFPPLPRRELERPSLLPRGRSALVPDGAAAKRRSRILEATIRTTAAKGYAAVTVAEIVAAARLTKGAFYSHFDSKLDAFLAAQRLGLQETLAAAAAAFYAERAWPDRVWAGLREFLRYFAENPEAAVFGIIEVHAAGEAAIRLEHDTRTAFTVFLEEGHRERAAAGASLPPITSEAVAAANYGLLRREVLRGKTEYAVRLLPQTAYLTLAPFLGPVETLAFIEGQVRAVR